MRYRKFKADHLFTGEKFLEGENVLISDESGKIINIVNASEAGEEVQSFTGILSPGFVNANCHL